MLGTLLWILFDYSVALNVPILTISGKLGNRPCTRLATVRYNFDSKLRIVTSFPCFSEKWQGLAYYCWWVNIPLFTGSYTSQLVQDFFNQQYQNFCDAESFFLNHVFGFRAPCVMGTTGTHKWLKTGTMAELLDLFYPREAPSYQKTTAFFRQFRFWIPKTCQEKNVGLQKKYRHKIIYPPEN